MVQKKLFIPMLCMLCFISNTIVGQTQLSSLNDFVQPVGNWVKANAVQMDVQNPETLIFKADGDCFVNGVNGKAKYLVTKDSYQDIELKLEFMLPKGSNSGIYFQSRYEVQLFDSWGVKDQDLTFYDCAGIQQRYDDTRVEAEKSFEGYAPSTNESKAPGEWQSLHVIFRAPKFNSNGEKIKNAQFDKVSLNDVVVHENIILSGPTKGTLSDVEVLSAPFRLQGGHGPVAFRNIRVNVLEQSCPK
ncbi:DUF1080 domain-containing protein [Formosa sp. PL04]|uniref:3-keto-disaccharide hydrolase n=1 Tax=Formosa sp. PL04 TaxID=3081755 RepID=UPI002981EBAF|nr:DUF1080 domain-containing protein [Formosa sp. PL04]MDW5290281.1 DUF1080 domain-containing protein [Formosa sp. PL04]